MRGREPVVGFAARMWRGPNRRPADWADGRWPGGCAAVGRRRRRHRRARRAGVDWPRGRPRQRGGQGPAGSIRRCEVRLWPRARRDQASGRGVRLRGRPPCRRGASRTPAGRRLTGLHCRQTSERGAWIADRRPPRRIGGPSNVPAKENRGSGSNPERIGLLLNAVEIRDQVGMPARGRRVCPEKGVTVVVQASACRLDAD